MLPETTLRFKFPTQQPAHAHTSLRCLLEGSATQKTSSSGSSFCFLLLIIEKKRKGNKKRKEKKRKEKKRKEKKRKAFFFFFAFLFFSFLFFSFLFFSFLFLFPFLFFSIIRCGYGISRTFSRNFYADIKQCKAGKSKACSPATFSHTNPLIISTI